MTKIFGSQARVKILRLFLFNPEQRFYIRQIARKLELQVNSARRELENLRDFGLLKVGEKEGLIKKEGESKEKEKEKLKKRTSQEKYYYIDQDFILFGELRSLFAKAQVLYKKDFVESIKKAGNPQLVVLAGLFVNNDKSPVDLLIVGKMEKNKIKNIIDKLEKDLGKELNYTIMNSSEFKYRRDITDIFLYNILETKNIIVIDKLEISESKS